MTETPAPTPASTTAVAPLVREVVVRTDPATAFALFTDRIGDWWPLATHGVFGEHATVAFEDDRLVERAGTSSTVWGEVVDWEPPHRFTITWHPGHDPAEATQVEVAFTVHDGSTLVRLTHTGWERRSRTDVRASYETGWAFVLAHFVRHVGPVPGG